MSCAAPSTGPGFLQATLAHLDCQAQIIGQAGYLALADPTSPLASTLSTVLALFIAVLGLRFLAGRPLAGDEWISAGLKIGIVLLLVTSWSGYRTIAYDLVLKGPAEIAGSIGRASSLPGSDGGLAARLQGLDNGMMALVEAGSGRLDLASQHVSGIVEPPVSDSVALGFAKTLFTASILGGFGLLRLGGGLFLALAPLFAGFLLFEATRFLFMGWLRVLMGIALASLGFSILLAAQLALMEPWLTQVLALRAARVATFSAPFELLAMTTAFALAALGLFALSIRTAFAPALTVRVHAAVERLADSLRHEARPGLTHSSSASNTIDLDSRARAIAQMLVQSSRNEAMGTTAFSSAPDARRSASPATRRSGEEALQPAPLGRGHNSATRRISAQRIQRRPGA